MAHRAGALSRGPPGPAHAPVGDEGLGLRLAWTTLGLGRRDGRGRQSVLARAIPELQDHVPVPRGQLRAGRRRAGALHRRRVSVVHPRHSPHGGGIAPHDPGLPPSSDPGHAMTALLQQWVTEQAERRPDATAVVMDGARMTYEELEASSNRLARTLKAAGCQQGDRVGLLLAKSPLAIVSMVGTLKADCTYVPLDASSPAPRVAKIVESAEPRVFLAEARAASLLSTLLSNARLRRSTAVGWMDRDRTRGEAFQLSFSLEDVTRAPGDPLDYRNSPAHPAHILFTSGSTGTPKGVVIPHRNVIHFVEWARRYFNLGPTDRVSGHPPLHFDLSTFDVFGTFASGAQLHLVPPEINLLPNALAEFIRHAELTQWFSVPSLLGYMAKFDVVQFNDFPALRRLLWCGEVFPTPALRYWMARLPHATFTNLYGLRRQRSRAAITRFRPVRSMTASRSRSGRRARVKSSWCSPTPCGPCHPGKSGTSTSAGWASARDTGAIRKRRAPRSSRTRCRPIRSIVSTGPATSPRSAPTVSCIFSAAPIRRSRAGVIGSSSGRSRPR